MENKMSTNKRFNLSIALLITTLFFLTNNLMAQQRQGQGPPQIPDEGQIVKMVDELSSELSLSDGQKSKILVLYKSHFAEVKALMNGGEKPSRDGMESLKNEFESDVKNLLTEEQQEAFDEFQKNKKEKSGQGKQRPPQR
jgi:hypothetical protein